MTVERVAVLGAGPGGVAAAAALARRGLEVRLFNRSLDRVAAVAEAGGVEIEGELGEEFVPFALVTDDPELAVGGADFVLCCTPAYGQRAMARLAAPHLAPTAAFVLASGSLGSLEVAQELAEGALIGETLSLPQSARMVAPNRVRIKLPSVVRLAAFPSVRNDELSELIGDRIPHRLGANVIDTGLHNVNFIIHPAPMLLNYGAIERADGAFSLMSEGMTEGTLRAMDAVDGERMAVCDAFGVRASSIDEVYVEIGSGPHVYRSQGEPFGLRDRIWPRYIDEDVPYGMVLISSLGDIAGVDTPLCDGITALLSVAEGRDLAAQGRTAARLGLGGMTRDDVCRTVEHGFQTTTTTRGPA
jgi:opine dehydrogenase